MAYRAGYRVGGGVVGALALLLGGAFLVPATATAAPLPAGCALATTNGPVTCTYTTAGTHTLTLPQGVTSVQVTAIGGRGGTFSAPGNARPGGRGAVVTGVAAVPAQSRTLYAVVGGNGANTEPSPERAGGTGGANGGGDGGTPNSPSSRVAPGAGGGGASDLRTSIADVHSRVVIAAGGGGAYINQQGGDAGASAGTSGGQAGTADAGGAGGTDGRDRASGADGSVGVGGAGAPSPSAPPPISISTGGGGGGGGLYGGGGGSAFGGGGGGSPKVPNGGTTALTTDPPSITITYQPTTSTPPICAGTICLPLGSSTGRS